MRMSSAVGLWCFYFLFLIQPSPTTNHHAKKSTQTFVQLFHSFHYYASRCRFATIFAGPFGPFGPLGPTGLSTLSEQNVPLVPTEPIGVPGPPGLNVLNVLAV